MDGWGDEEMDRCGNEWVGSQKDVWIDAWIDA